MIEPMTITNRTVVGEAGEMSDEEMAALQGRLGRLIEREFERAFGFVPQIPTVLELRPRCCHGAFLHHPNCPTWGSLT